VQIGEYVSADAIFGGEYAYFSSYSDTWVEHARRYAESMIRRFGIDATKRVVEVASNDGYLLQHFHARGIPVLGIEPAANVAEVAIGKGIETVVEFLGAATARDLAAARGRADLLVGNNVLAHVPDLNDFVAGLRILLAPGGVLTMEFPHLLRLIEENQFDTIYHEHFSYFWLHTAERVFAAHGLTVFDVEELPTHGGSLRVYVRHAAEDGPPPGERLSALRARETAAGYGTTECYRDFDERVRETKRRILEFLIRVRREGKHVVAYGAPGKGNTLLNYCGIRQDFLDYAVDRNPYKHGRYTPGTRIPIHAPDRIRKTRPDYLFILPWNLKAEIMRQNAFIREWGGRFVVPIPALTVHD
jgi:2-polyprenyl-3-methyl-5-hydroxy-6-metoxy-1,4-benzoquinol methylase